MILLPIVIFIMFLLFMSHQIMMLKRNNDVFIFRITLLKLVSKYSRMDSQKGREYMWRWKRLESVRYEEMLHKFWKPLDSFYDDYSFIKP